MSRALKKANREAANRRKQLEALNSDEEDVEDDTEDEEAGPKVKMTRTAAKLQKRLSEAEARAAKAEERARTLAIKGAFVREATAAGILEEAIDDAFKLADLSEVEITDDGEVEGVKDVVADLVDQKPYLVSGEQKPPKKKATNTDAEKRGAGNQLPVDEVRARKSRSLEYGI